MEKPLLLQGKIPKLQQLFGKNWLQYGRACCQSRVGGGRVSKSVEVTYSECIYFKNSVSIADDVSMETSANSQPVTATSDLSYDATGFDTGMLSYRYLSPV